MTVTKNSKYLANIFRFFEAKTKDFLEIRFSLHHLFSYVNKYFQH